MKGKTLGVVVSGLMALSLMVAACGTATTSTSSSTTSSSQTTSTSAPSTSVTTTSSIPQPSTTAAGAKEPKYGGIYTRVLTADPTGGWDPTVAQAIRVSHMQLTSNELMQGDWAKGPQGLGLTSWQYGYLCDVSLETGELAENWEFPDDTTIIYHIRKGAKFQNLPPANGREVTADDVVWNMQMQFNYPGTWQAIAYPPEKPAQVTGSMLPGDPRRPSEIKALDKYTVQVKVPAASQGLMFLEIGDNAYTNPPEIWNGKGAGQGLGMLKWSQVVGSGPFMLTNYVAGSLIEYTRNPNYYEIDPLYPGKNYQWPYVDKVRQLIIPDLSTRQAAFRVGKIDTLTGVILEDKNQFVAKNSNIQLVKQVSTRYIAAGRLDKPNLPFADVRVRQALNMAIDKQSYMRDFQKGDADFLGYPYPSDKAWGKYYTPLDQQPPEVQQLFTYDPDKAKQLLKEAGFPNGFKAVIDVPSSVSTAVDEVSILKDYLGKVGVDLTIKMMEAAVYSNVQTNKSMDDMFFGACGGIWAPNEQLTTKAGMRENFSCQSDPYYAQIGTVIARDLVKNPDNYFKTMKEEGVFELKSAWGIFMPVQYTYNMWWPWVQNYMGINWTGWAGQLDWYKSIWIDEDMKKSMGY
jgi:peptide/nickel transport system substrate-binding protein